MSDPLDWNAKTIAEFRTRAGLAGTSRVLPWSWCITAVAKAGVSMSLR
jgi:hypothetical protein